MKILIIGATSAIAKATARIYAERKHELFLIARNEDRLNELAADLRVRGALLVGHTVVNLSKHRDHAKAIEAAFGFLDSIDVALICHGSLPDQDASETDFKLAEKEININGLSVISLLTLLSQKLKLQGNGSIAVITSVAGDRGRATNFVYGAAKSMVSTYLQGMRGNLFPHNVHVLDIRPGLVDSPMTAHLKKGPLWSSPERVADKIVRSIETRKHTVYAPGYWRGIMFVVKLVPEFVFKRLNI